MKLTAESRPDFERLVDRSCEPGASIVRRYRRVVRFDDRPGRDQALRERVTETSIREGVRLVRVPEYKGVAIDILDETSAMAAGSIKSIDGCLTVAVCRADGERRIAFESGGNTGTALTLYGRRAGMETFFFCPCDNVDLLEGRLFGDPGAHLIGVADRGRVKEFAALFARRAGIPQVPDRSWRRAAGMFRGMFILETMFAGGAYDWIAQAVSAAFGPIGIYRVLNAFRGDIGRLPGFLGVQQEANCPMFRAWNPEAARRLDGSAGDAGPLLARVMYDSAPATHDTWGELRGLLLLTGGDLLTVSEEEFDSRLRPSAGFGPVLDVLRSCGIAITAGPGGIVDKTGMLALAGVLKAIDAGTVRAGSRVLCCLTGGVTDADGRARPERVVREARDVLIFAATLREGR